MSNSVVHARAAGAFGEFEVTHDISHLTKAKFLNGIGKKTKVLHRISTVGGQSGSSETVRDVRGFAVKFYTEEGNHDIVGNDIVRQIGFCVVESRIANNVAKTASFLCQGSSQVPLSQQKS